MIREKILIKNIIKKINLSLNELTILTEVGSNNFIYTPIISIMAGAKKVFAWTKDSKYGMGKDIIEDCIDLCKKFNCVFVFIISYK